MKCISRQEMLVLGLVRDVALLGVLEGRGHVGFEELLIDDRGNRTGLICGGVHGFGLVNVDRNTLVSLPHCVS